MTEETSTKKRLRLAFAKLRRDAGREGKLGPSINAVAREAGVSHALIHNKYPDIADQIRDANGRGPKPQLEKQRTLVKHAENRSAGLRKDIIELKTQNRGLASENARLLLLVRDLERKIVTLRSGAILFDRDQN